MPVSEVRWHFGVVGLTLLLLVGSFFGVSENRQNLAERHLDFKIRALVWLDLLNEPDRRYEVQRIDELKTPVLAKWYPTRHFFRVSIGYSRPWMWWGTHPYSQFFAQTESGELSILKSSFAKDQSGAPVIVDGAFHFLNQNPVPLDSPESALERLTIFTELSGKGLFLTQEKPCQEGWDEATPYPPDALFKEVEAPRVSETAFGYHLHFYYLNYTASQPPSFQRPAQIYQADLYFTHSGAVVYSETELCRWRIPLPR